MPHNKELSPVEINYLINKEISKLVKESPSSNNQIYQQRQPQQKEITLPVDNIPQKNPLIANRKDVDILDVIKPSQTLAISKPDSNFEVNKTQKINLKNFVEEKSNDPIYLSY